MIGLLAKDRASIFCLKNPSHPSLQPTSLPEKFMQVDSLTRLTEFIKIQEQALGETAELATTLTKLGELQLNSESYADSISSLERAVDILSRCSSRYQDEFTKASERLEQARTRINGDKSLPEGPGANQDHDRADVAALTMSMDGFDTS